MSDEPRRVDLETPSLSLDRMARFKELFPGVVADGVLDASRLGELLDTEVAAASDGAERFGLMWAGKQAAVRSLMTPSRGTLVPDFGRSRDFDVAGNVFVEGENLEVLKLLQKAYNDKVDLIYVDPPYNTGNDFIYDDDFTDGLRQYLEYSGQVDDAGNRRHARTEILGRRHSRWLSLMYPRLVLARNLLTQNGIIAISIDDNEVAALRSVMDEVFGAENFLNTFVWVSNLKGRQISGSGAAATKEYIHLYARNIEEAGEFRVSASMMKELMPSAYKGFNYEVKTDDYGPYVLKNELHNTNSKFNEMTRPNLVFDIYYDPTSREVKTEALSDAHAHEGFIKISPKQNNNGTHRYHAFRWGREKVGAENHNLEFVKSAAGWKVFTKVRDVDSTALKDLFIGIGTSDGAADLKSLGVNPAWFDYPKPARLIQVLVAACTEADSVVLDFFAGSGTTAHAVALQNSLDGGSRRTISVNLPEPTAEGSDARKAGIDVVSKVTHARLLAVGATVPGARKLGLRTLRLAESHFRGRSEAQSDTLIDLSPSSLTRPGHKPEALAAEVLAKEGVPLEAAWTRYEAGEADVIEAGGTAVVLCFAITDEVVRDALALGARVVVFLEDGFADADAVKANAVTNARNLGITMKTV